MQCKRMGICSFYHGETSRTLYTRIKEHLSGDPKQKALLKHNRLFHPNTNPDFNITQVSYYKAPLGRQINEGVRINNTKSHEGYLMNSKSEFHQGEVPRVMIMSGLQ